jgi:hypothetical protein
MTESDHIDRTEIRRTVRKTIDAIDGEGAPRDDLEVTVAATAEVPRDAVEREIDELEKTGFVYLVDGVVKLP